MVYEPLAEEVLTFILLPYSRREHESSAASLSHIVSHNPEPEPLYQAPLLTANLGRTVEVSHNSIVISPFRRSQSAHGSN
jgi:hypothetical protein